MEAIDAAGTSLAPPSDEIERCIATLRTEEAESKLFAFSDEPRRNLARLSRKLWEAKDQRSAKLMRTRIIEIAKEACRDQGTVVMPFQSTSNPESERTWPFGAHDTAFAPDTEEEERSAAETVTHTLLHDLYPFDLITLD